MNYAYDMTILVQIKNQVKYFIDFIKKIFKSWQVFSGFSFTSLRDKRQSSASTIVMNYN